MPRELPISVTTLLLSLSGFALLSSRLWLTFGWIYFQQSSHESSPPREVVFVLEHSVRVRFIHAGLYIVIAGAWEVHWIDRSNGTRYLRLSKSFFAVTVDSSNAMISASSVERLTFFCPRLEQEVKSPNTIVVSRTDCRACSLAVRSKLLWRRSMSEVSNEYRLPKFLVPVKCGRARIAKLCSGFVGFPRNLHKKDTMNAIFSLLSWLTTFATTPPF